MALLASAYVRLHPQYLLGHEVHWSYFPYCNHATGLFLLEANGTNGGVWAISGGAHTERSGDFEMQVRDREREREKQGYSRDAWITLCFFCYLFGHLRCSAPYKAVKVNTRNNNTE